MICFDNHGKGGEGDHCSTLWQPRLAHPINNMLDVLGVLAGEKRFGAFNCETGVGPLPGTSDRRGTHEAKCRRMGIISAATYPA
jgi:hypothetical protein